MGDSLSLWLASDPCRIERNDCTRLHKLSDALLAGEIYDPSGEVLKPDVAVADRAIFIPPQTFVVRHDWLAAVGETAAEVGNEFRLPFPHCAFEFRINGRTFVNIAMQPESGELSCCGFVECDGRWICVGEFASEFAPAQFAWEQIRSICVALDAEVAVHDVVRAPSKLNDKRARNGLTPVSDHRVIDLSRRHRTLPATGSDQPKGSKRLHFRRGHWRHYEDHKTWIKWTLVGNPDLGFIDHHYSL